MVPIDAPWGAPSGGAKDRKLLDIAMRKGGTISLAGYGEGNPLYTHYS